MHIYMYIHTYTHTHIHTYTSSSQIRLASCHPVKSDRQMHRQATDKYTDRQQIDRQNPPTGKRQTHECTDMQQTDRQIYRHATDRQTDRQTNVETGKQYLVA